MVIFPGHIPGDLATHLGCKGIRSGPDLQSLANPLKLWTDKFEVPSQQSVCWGSQLPHCLLKTTTVEGVSWCSCGWLLATTWGSTQLELGSGYPPDSWCMWWLTTLLRLLSSWRHCLTALSSSSLMWAFCSQSDHLCWKENPISPTTPPGQGLVLDQIQM